MIKWCIPTKFNIKPENGWQRNAPVNVVPARVRYQRFHVLYVDVSTPRKDDMVSNTGQGKWPSSARSSISMGCPWPRRGIRTARRPVRTKNITVLCPTAQAPLWRATRRTVLSKKSCKVVFHAPNAVHTGSSGTRSTCGPGFGLVSGVNL